ncbi:MAG: hypothetical protein QY318_00580 [Candidatus Dojkabacteria bacterium]|nr:MAG: hypothetical protein QY318_00580 [Candidatus Dojkabacteria bacterium]
MGENGSHRYYGDRSEMQFPLRVGERELPWNYASTEIYQLSYKDLELGGRTERYRIYYCEEIEPDNMGLTWEVPEVLREFDRRESMGYFLLYQEVGKELAYVTAGALDRRWEVILSFSSHYLANQTVVRVCHRLMFEYAQGMRRNGDDPRWRGVRG